ncbi:DUF3987 domain-containing protein [Brenneria izadpanahii]|uniref:DUF3987 domain-containing protein n=1 Tax=Brenneria izadpanahii TaxID=2722756 RepID=A0ABX7V034_9GAMM|nr:YfjI family protein [Brenneria izadpanahii]QTF10217.1 DUF3987 domain-containing protein [Brenneria izadpanahii]
MNYLANTNMVAPNSHLENPTFPSEKIPDVLRDAISAVSSKTQAPIPLIFASAMAPIALLAQGMIDVSPKDGLTFPVSCNFLTVAESGERKSTVDKIFMQPIHEHEKIAYLKHQEDLKKYKFELDIWEMELSAIKNNLKNNTRKKLPTDDVKAQLMEHFQNEPQLPRKVQLLANDITPAALQHLLHTGGGSLALHSSEGGEIINSQAFKNLALLNELWDGMPISVTRRHSESYKIFGSRLSANIMVQNAPLHKYLKHAHEQVRGSGFLARFFFSFPISTIGTRIGNMNNNYHNLILPYYSRLNQMLNHYLGTLTSKNKNRTLLHFSPDAKNRWIYLCDQIERRVGVNGDYFSIRDFASKEGNKIARMAALFHYFSNEDGDITLENVENAVAVCQWYLSEALRILTPEPQYISDANVLYEWLIERFHMNNFQPIKKNHIRQYGPNSLRQYTRFESALRYLHDTGKIQVAPYGKTIFVYYKVQNKSVF